MNSRVFPRRAISIMAILIGLTTNALAGPPLICHPIAIAQAKSLPWVDLNYHKGLGSYDLKNLTKDTLAILDSNTSVLVRMETLRRATLYALARAVASGALALDPGADRTETYQQLLRLPGIGEWTAGYIVMRALGDPDTFLPGDLGIRKAGARLGLGTNPRAMSEHAAAWREWLCVSIKPGVSVRPATSIATFAV